MWGPYLRQNTLSANASFREHDNDTILHNVHVVCSNHLNSWNNNYFKNEVNFKKRSQMEALWFKLLNERKQAYWNAIKSENLTDTYETWKRKGIVISAEISSKRNYSRDKRGDKNQN